jgi:hypothetical protein
MPKADRLWGLLLICAVLVDDAITRRIERQHADRLRKAFEDGVQEGIRQTTLPSRSGAAVVDDFTFTKENVVDLNDPRR